MNECVHVCLLHVCLLCNFVVSCPSCAAIGCLASQNCFHAESPKILQLKIVLMLKPQGPALQNCFDAEASGAWLPCRKQQLQSYLPRVKHLGKCFSIRCKIPAATVAFKAMPAVLLKCPIHPGTPETRPPGRRGMHNKIKSKAARIPIISPSPRFSCSFRLGMACLAF